MPFAKALHLGVIPYFPLAAVVLAGMYRHNQPIPEGSRGAYSTYVQQYLHKGTFDILEELETITRSRGRSLA